MAKVAFSKLGLKPCTDVKTIDLNNNVQVEVKQYLPVAEKLELVSRVLANAADNNNFANPVKLEVFTALEIVFTYTNLSFTEKQKEDLTKLYDLLEGNDIINAVVDAIPDVEYNAIIEAVEGCADAIYSYHNSVLGILEAVSTDYSNLGMEATGIQKALGDPNNLTLLKTVMDKMG